MDRRQGKNREVCENEPAKKMKHSRPESGEMPSVCLLLTEAKRNVNLLFSEYTDVFRGRAAEDAELVRELEDTIAEVRCLESHLKEKKEHLRQSLAIISDKLG
ncbi:hypothetical protein DNTS_017989 [Danionella cerebrum]|uniref:Uncharacterized protein n=1 Tax=Danionella cerebrum TaxID=2873325 RepID=A0A553Q4L3_9TELE|nr:hypothetical protein DNTS_017989 [Danionella translucida]